MLQNLIAPVMAMRGLGGGRGGGMNPMAMIPGGDQGLLGPLKQPFTKQGLMDFVSSPGAPGLMRMLQQAPSMLGQMGGATGGGPVAGAQTLMGLLPTLLAHGRR